MRPFCCSSSRLMQRISVDLPDPEGPQITMRSPLATVRSMSRRTWNCPYHLLTPIIWIVGPSSARGRVLCVARVMFRIPLSAPRSRTHVALQVLTVLRHEEAEDEIDQSDEQVALDEVYSRIRIGTSLTQHSAPLGKVDKTHPRLN